MAKLFAAFPHIEKDFKDVCELLQQGSIISTDATKGALSAARTIHRLTYSLIVWKFRLNKLPLRGQVFLDELASDAIQILPQIMLGYSKTTKLLIRGVIENGLRHVYFLDHKIEFHRMNSDAK
jgi:hypothetical protein